MMLNKSSTNMFQPSFLLLLMLIMSSFGQAQTNKQKTTPPPPPPKAAAAAPRPAPAPARPAAAQPRPNTTQPRPGTNTGGATGNQPRTATNQPRPQPTPPRPGSNQPHTFTPPPRPPVASSHPLPNGGRSVTNGSGHTFNYGSNGHLTSMTTRNGTVAHYSPGGRLTSIHSGGTTIYRGSRGSQTIVTQRPNGVRVVTRGPNHGYVEHPFARNGQQFIRRTYVVNGHAFAHVYRGYPYRGAIYYRYVPAFYYGPAFYGWAYRPWGVSIAFGWGWGPWYPAYGYYFAPYPAYADASLWLTDYVLAANLQLAYEAQQTNAAGAPAQDNSAPAPQAQPDQSDDNSNGNANGTVLTPELKAAISEEVKQQLAAERDAASGSQSQAAPSADQVPEALSPTERTFIVSTTLVQQLDDGTECSLNPGDVLTRIADTPDTNQNVKVMISSSQKGSCHSGLQMDFAVQALQDMHNDFHQRLDDGLHQLAQNQGQNGMPAGPAADSHPSPDGQAQPDLTASADLQQQQQQASQLEQDVRQASSNGTGQ